MNLKKFKLDCYNKIINDYKNNQDIYMFFLYPLVLKLKTKDFKNYNYSIFLKLKKKQPVPFKEYNVIKKYTKKNLDKDIQTIIKCIFWSDYIDKNNIYAIYYVKKHLSTKKQSAINLINLLYRLLTNAPTIITGGKTKFSFSGVKNFLSNSKKAITKGITKGVNIAVNSAESTYIFAKNLLYKSTFILFDRLFINDFNYKNLKALDDDIFITGSFSKYNFQKIFKTEKELLLIKKIFNMGNNATSNDEYIKLMLKEIIFFLTSVKKTRSIKTFFKKEAVIDNEKIYKSIISDIEFFNTTFSIKRREIDNKLSKNEIDSITLKQRSHTSDIADNVLNIGNNEQIVSVNNVVELCRIINYYLDLNDGKDYTEEIIKQTTKYLRRNTYTTWFNFFKNTSNSKLDHFSGTIGQIFSSIFLPTQAFLFAPIDKYATMHVYYNIFLLYEMISFIKTILLNKYGNIGESTIEYINKTFEYIQFSYIFYLINYYVVTSRKRISFEFYFPYTRKSYLNGLKKCVFVPISFLLETLKNKQQEHNDKNITKKYDHISKNIELMNKVYFDKITKYSYLIDNKEYKLEYRTQNNSYNISNNTSLLFRFLLIFSSNSDVTNYNGVHNNIVNFFINYYKKYLLYCTLQISQEYNQSYQDIFNECLIKEASTILSINYKDDLLGIDPKFITTQDTYNNYIENIKFNIQKYYFNTCLDSILHFLKNPNESIEQNFYIKKIFIFIFNRKNTKKKDIIPFIEKLTSLVAIKDKNTYVQRISDFMKSRETFKEIKSSDNKYYNEYCDEEHNKLKTFFLKFIISLNVYIIAKNYNIYDTLNFLYQKFMFNINGVVINRDNSNLYDLKYGYLNNDDKFILNIPYNYDDFLNNKEYGIENFFHIVYEIICEILKNKGNEYIKSIETNEISNHLYYFMIKYKDYYELLKNTSTPAFIEKFKEDSKKRYNNIKDIIKYNIDYISENNIKNTEINKLIFLYSLSYINSKHSNINYERKLRIIYTNCNLYENFWLNLNARLSLNINSDIVYNLNKSGTHHFDILKCYIVTYILNTILFYGKIIENHEFNFQKINNENEKINDLFKSFFNTLKSIDDNKDEIVINQIRYENEEGHKRDIPTLGLNGLFIITSDKEISYDKSEATNLDLFKINKIESFLKINKEGNNVNISNGLLFTFSDESKKRYDFNIKNFNITDFMDINNTLYKNDLSYIFDISDDKVKTALLIKKLKVNNEKINFNENENKKIIDDIKALLNRMIIKINNYEKDKTDDEDVKTDEKQFYLNIETENKALNIKEIIKVIELFQNELNTQNIIELNKLNLLSTYTVNYLDKRMGIILKDIFTKNKNHFHFISLINHILYVKYRLELKEESKDDILELTNEIKNKKIIDLMAINQLKIDEKSEKENQPTIDPEGKKNELIVTLANDSDIPKDIEVALQQEEKKIDSTGIENIGDIEDTLPTGDKRVENTIPTDDKQVENTTSVGKPATKYRQEMKRLEEEREKEKREKEELEKKIQDLIDRASNDIQQKINENRKSKNSINVNDLLQAEINKIESNLPTISVKEKARIYDAVIGIINKTIEIRGGSSKVKNNKLKLLIKYILSHLVSSKK